MNKPIIIAIIATLALVIFLPTTTLSQEKKVQLKTVKVVDGKKVVNDTTFTLKEGEDEKEIIKTLSWVSEEDSTGTITIDMEIDSEDGHDGHNKVIILKSGKDGDFAWTQAHGGKKCKYLFKSDEFEDIEHNLHILKELDVELDESKLKEIELKLAKHNEKLHDLHIKLDDEKLIALKELEVLKEIENLEEIIELEKLHKLKELENIEIVIPDIPEISYFPDHNEFYFDKYHKHHMHDNASDRELRDAGIKNKINKLEANDYDITIDDGVVGLSFTLATEGMPKVTVYNYFGDKVFSGKSELMNGKYAIRIDLSAKQNGVYYIQVTQKNSSFTKKLRLH